MEQPGKVEIEILGRCYTLSCAPGEEDRLQELGARFQARTQEIQDTVGDLGELRLLVAAGLSFIDELDAARGAGAVDREEDIENRLIHLEWTAAAALNDAASRISEIASRVEKAS